jgi:Tol biopolymer transport system component
VLAMMAVIAGLFWVLRPSRSLSPQPVVRFEVATPPSSDPTSFALSADGSLLVFSALSDGASKLWVRPLDQTTALPMAGTEGARFPFWSPDGHSIGFFADGKLKRVDVAGGPPQILAEAPTGRGGTWSPEGIILFCPTLSAAPPTVLMRVSARGGTPTPATHLAAGQANHRWPEFLPDGRRFIFFSFAGRPDTNGVFLGSLDGREPIRLLPAETAALFAPPNTLLVVRQGVLRAMQFDPDRGAIRGEEVPMANVVGTDYTVQRSPLSVSRTGVLAYRTGGGQRRQLVWVDRNGRQLGPVGSADDSGIADPGLDPSGRLVVVHRFVGGKGDVWVMDPQRGIATRLTFDPTLANNPVWSADGRRVFFLSTREGAANLFEQAAGGVGEEHLMLRNAGTPLSASSDGRFILYMRTDPTTGDDIWALPLVGDDRKPFPVLQTAADERAAEFSPDSRWLAYESNESGRFEIYIRSFPAAGAKGQVSTNGGTQPRWRHDGKELYYLAPDGHLTAVAISASADGETLDASVPVPLFLTRLASGGGVVPSRSQYAVAPDGRFLMNTVFDEASAPPITIVLNWQAGLKK